MTSKSILWDTLGCFVLRYCLLLKEGATCITISVNSCVLPVTHSFPQVFLSEVVFRHVTPLRFVWDFCIEINDKGLEKCGSHHCLASFELFVPLQRPAVTALDITASRRTRPSDARSKTHCPSSDRTPSANRLSPKGSGRDASGSCRLG